MRYFIDTEFNGFGGELLSLALVSENSENDLYTYVPRPPAQMEPFVAENVWPRMELHQGFVAPADYFGTLIYDTLCRDSDVEIIADWPDDIRYFCQCLITGPGQMVQLNNIRMTLFRCDLEPYVDPAHRHNAFYDADGLRRVYNRHRSQ